MEALMPQSTVPGGRSRHGRDGLAGIELARGLSDLARRDLARSVEWLEVRAGETLFQRGDRSGSVYVVVSGRLRVDGGADVAAGSHVGGLELLTGARRAL